MGKKDWCSQKGWDARAKGMKEIETNQRKIMYSVLFGISAIIYLAIGATQLSHWSNAEAINEDFSHSITELAYDSCEYPDGYETDPENIDDATAAAITLAFECGFDVSCYRAGTSWTHVWGANGLVMIFMAFNFVLMSVGGFHFYPRCIGTWCNAFCACCCHGAVIGLAMSGRYRAMGTWCSFNIRTSEYDGSSSVDGGHTYADEAGTIAALCWLQAIFCCVQCWCCCLPFRNTPVFKDKKNKELQVTISQTQMQQQQQMM